LQVELGVYASKQLSASLHAAFLVVSFSKLPDDATSHVAVMRLGVGALSVTYM
jgi:hypothetical protein